jgi:hypothetical protein
MNKARDQRKMIYSRHPLTEGPSAQDARQAADHHGSGQAEFRFPGVDPVLVPDLRFQEQCQVERQNILCNPPGPGNELALCLASLSILGRQIEVQSRRNRPTKRPVRKQGPITDRSQEFWRVPWRPSKKLTIYRFWFIGSHVFPSRSSHENARSSPARTRSSISR